MFHLLDFAHLPWRDAGLLRPGVLVSSPMKAPSQCKLCQPQDLRQCRKFFLALSSSLCLRNHCSFIIFLFSKDVHKNYILLHVYFKLKYLLCISYFFIPFLQSMLNVLTLYIFEESCNALFQLFSDKGLRKLWFHLGLVKGL